MEPCSFVILLRRGSFIVLTRKVCYTSIMIFMEEEKQKMQTYCGKNCEACTYKAELSCSGCQSGPGRVINGECKLARCCREKGHETCETCGFKRNCGMWLDKGAIPKQRMEHKQEEKEKEAVIARRAPFLGKWIWIFFWLIVPQTIANFMTRDAIVALVPALEILGQVGLILCVVIRVLILFLISKEHKYYAFAAMLGLASSAVNILVLLLGIEDIYVLIMLAGVQIAVVLISEYYEYKAHAEVVLIVDGAVSGQWDSCWNWNLYSCIGVIASMFLMSLIPLLGTLAMLASAIGMLVAGYKKLVCLYRTAQVFRRYEE